MPGGSHRVGKEGGSWREPRQLSAEQRGDREPASLGYGRRVGTAPQGDIKGRIDPENDPKAALALTGAGLKFGQVQLGQLVSSPAITRRNGGKVVVHGMSITAPAGVDLVVGARTGGVQLMLYSVFHVGQATNNIEWTSFAALASHPAVLEAAVVPHPDDEGLLKPKAFIVLRQDIELDGLDRSLKEHVKLAVGMWKYPRWVEIVEGLPKTATGKIQRFKLREGA